MNLEGVIQALMIKTLGINNKGWVRLVKLSKWKDGKEVAIY
jgi:hypothetical protein